MAYQAVFKRYELKYMLTTAQKQRLLAVMEPYMALDKYGRTTIRNIYFDTPNYRLARHSIEKPPYKEKLRIRSYSQARPDSTVFVELKKKYEDVVYKRRLSMKEADAVRWICQGNAAPKDSQIAREIDYFLDFYQTLQPTVFLSYQREAFYCRSGGDFRMTFDDHIFVRQEAMSLEEHAWGTPILADGLVLMEVKCSGGIPRWLTDFLTREKIYKTSFSKYGTAYQTLIYPNENPKGDIIYA